MMPDAYEVSVESVIPGRLRLRLPRHQRRPEIMSDIHLILNGTNGIRKVIVNSATGSILVENDPSIIDSGKLIDSIKARPAFSMVESRNSVTEQPWPGKSKAGVRIIRDFKKFDQAVSWATKGTLDGKMSVVLMLFALSLGRAFFSERRVVTPWYTLLWYSYSMFMHWYNPTKSAQSV